MSALGLVFLMVGVGSLIGGLVAMGRTKSFLAQAREARAEVVAVQQRTGSNRQKSYYPVFRYRTEQGATKDVVSSVGSNPPRYKEGDSLAILYDPAKPDSVRIHSFFNVWAGALILGAIGVIFLIVAGITMATSG
ncbi:DUF3592 domain-containing protein [Hyalangium gracile]|uniref:DUF3592 domain-containing protein n=1 Tax=Hyalangium gracile TaxID=394092 RepID=UPI001CC97740|nr:DUF3592 domain-containing protein [Hyalangium gracile]